MQYRLLLGLLAGLLFACTPEPLTQFADGGGGGGNNGTNNGGGGDMGGGTNNGGGGDMGGGGSFTTDFLAVADIVTERCAQPACHAPPNAMSGEMGDFVLAAGANATPEEIRTVLEGTTTGSSKSVNGQLIVPSNADQSEFYFRLITSDNMLIMPTTGALPMDQINTVRDWINDGANYVQ